ncbi:protein translocase subunit SecD [Acetivibrio clariflavus]|uniref:Protein translocase subunit SecD n=1 Tax=Acetivibrio clariflavus (strain DSM 19732 / NBRC 101661 / EBR45) TaxID=720554 RepID=G8LWQ4_ACECE|nr:protein translocase subunit SecD [Acetivibrio clariflavus]AEV68722.1 protein-export membrane protein, SecD/SecF family [Acetivibrio clariflavus DSM 19732]
MKGNYGIKSLFLILIIGLLTYISIAGLVIQGTNIDIPKVSENIRYGIDIRGGVRAVLTAPADVNPTDEQMEAAKQVVENRLDFQKVYDRTVLLEKNNKRIIVEIPWRQDEKEFDPNKAINELGMTAQLTFREVDKEKVDENGNYLPLDDKIILKGDDVVKAAPETNPNTGKIYVALKLSSEGAKKFEEATGRLVGEPLAIFMDEQLISAPTVREKISGDSAVIEISNADPNAAIKEATELANTINAGALPFKLEAVQIESISPTLGKSALDVILRAGLIAGILVILFMLLYYRLPGIIADIALIFQIVTQVLIISSVGMSLTLAGIAGIILTIGMGVDANVIIYERIKEEIRSGKTVKAAIDAGFDRAFAAIFDGNITTLIVAVVLYFLGSGPIQSFAFTLGLGVLLNFITAIVISRTFLRAVSSYKITKSRWLYGVRGGNSNV